MTDEEAEKWVTALNIVTLAIAGAAGLGVIFLFLPYIIMGRNGLFAGPVVLGLLVLAVAEVRRRL
jgi:hypothetical protein